MRKIILLVLLIPLLTTNCTTIVSNKTAGSQRNSVDSVSSATPKGTGWEITLTGVRTDKLWQSQYNSWKETEGIYTAVELEKKGKTKVYQGISFDHIIAIADDPSGEYPFSFQKDLWEKGYDITLTANDGYSFTFSTKELSAAEIYLVDNLDGESIPPMIAGNINGKAWVKNLAEIELGLTPVALNNNSFEFTLEINGQSAMYTIGELEALPIYIEDKGQYTNSYGNVFSGVYGGVKLIPLLSQFMDVKPETAIKIIATDGYEMDYSGEMLLDQKDGDWILAFKENGEYMPEDPGYIRLLKVGPQEPNIESQLSARMIKKIICKGGDL